MLNTTSYYEQSKGLTDNEKQRLLLRLTDASTAVREVGKIGTIAGGVSTTVSIFFDFSPTLPLLVTTISTFIWICGFDYARSFEPHAKTMLEQLQAIKERTENSPTSAK